MTDNSNCGDLSVEVDSPITAPNYYSNLGNLIQPPQYHSSSLNCYTNYISKTDSPYNILYAIQNDFINELTKTGMSVNLKHSITGDPWSITIVATAKDGIMLDNMLFLNQNNDPEYVVNCQISVMDDSATHVRFRKIAGSSVMHSLVFKILEIILNNISDPTDDEINEPVPISRRYSHDLEIDPLADPVQPTWSPPPPPPSNGGLCIRDTSRVIDDCCYNDDLNINNVKVQCGGEVRNDDEVCDDDDEVCDDDDEVRNDDDEVRNDDEVRDDDDEVEFAYERNIILAKQKVHQDLMNLREDSLNERENFLNKNYTEFNEIVKKYNSQIYFQRITDISVTIILCSIIATFWN